MKNLPSESVDAVVTDPPYGLSSHSQHDIVNALTAWLAGEEYEHGKKGFMGKEWDSFVPSPTIWREVWRVLKPGAHVLCASGTRTVDLMGISLRLAGFEIRDTIEWLYGSGFPKSASISKQIDKAAGAEREVIGYKKQGTASMFDGGKPRPATLPATLWEGFGTALKPAHEPFILARKPIEKGLSIAENCLKYGTGGIDIDGCRVSLENESIERKSCLGKLTNVHMEMRPWMQKRHEQGIPLKQDFINTTGRFPANVIHDGSECVVSCFPDVKSGGSGKYHTQSEGMFYFGKQATSRDVSDSGSAARFFYCAKASPSERDKGCERDFLKEIHRLPVISKNYHPTVKPIRLMEYLTKLISCENQVVLDPFMGSGTTGIACRNLNRQFIGIEICKEYYDIAYQRIHEELPPVESSDGDTSETLEKPQQPKQYKLF